MSLSPEIAEKLCLFIHDTLGLSFSSEKSDDLELKLLPVMKLNTRNDLKSFNKLLSVLLSSVCLGSS